MPERLRIGVIGASWYSDLRHLPALKNHPHADTVAICDVINDRAEEMDWFSGMKPKEAHLMLGISEIYRHEGQIAAIPSVEKRIQGT